MVYPKIKNALIDLLGKVIRISGRLGFPGKGRLIWFWMNNRNQRVKHIRILPGGARLFCDFSIPYEAMVWLCQEEQADLEILQGLLKTGQIFVDCGANIGIWTLTAASRIGKNGKVYAFEPDPTTFEKLSFNVSWQKTNNENIKLFNLAVGDVDGKFPFKCDQQHNLSQIVTELNNESILVPVITIDHIFNRNEPINGIKIDVEGFELNVLKGAEATLRRCRPWLCVEFNTIIAGVNRLCDWTAHQYLRRLGYRCHKFKDALLDSTKNTLSDYWWANGYYNLYYSIKK